MSSPQKTTVGWPGAEKFLSNSLSLPRRWSFGFDRSQSHTQIHPRKNGSGHRPRDRISEEGYKCYMHNEGRKCVFPCKVWKSLLLEGLRIYKFVQAIVLTFIASKKTAELNGRKQQIFIHVGSRHVSTHVIMHVYLWWDWKLMHYSSKTCFDNCDSLHTIYNS